LADQYRLSYAAQIARRLPPYVPPSELQIQKSRPEGRLFIWLPPYDFASLSFRPREPCGSVARLVHEGVVSFLLILVVAFIQLALAQSGLEILEKSLIGGSASLTLMLMWDHLWYLPRKKQKMMVYRDNVAVFAQRYGNTEHGRTTLWSLMPNFSAMAASVAKGEKSQIGVLDPFDEVVLGAAKEVLLPKHRDLKAISDGARESAVEFAKQMGAGDLGDSVEAGGDLFEALWDSGLEETAEGAALLAVAFTTGMVVKSGWRWLSDLVTVPAVQREAAAKLKEEKDGLGPGCISGGVGCGMLVVIIYDFGMAAVLYFNI
jgi:hypothetical protein